MDLLHQLHQSRLESHGVVPSHELIPLTHPRLNHDHEATFHGSINVGRDLIQDLIPALALIIHGGIEPMALNLLITAQHEAHHHLECADVGQRANASPHGLMVLMVPNPHGIILNE